MIFFRKSDYLLPNSLNIWKQNILPCNFRLIYDVYHKDGREIITEPPPLYDAACPRAVISLILLAPHVKSKQTTHWDWRNERAIWKPGISETTSLPWFYIYLGGNKVFQAFQF